MELYLHKADFTSPNQSNPFDFNHLFPDGVRNHKRAKAHGIPTIDKTNIVAIITPFGFYKNRQSLLEYQAKTAYLNVISQFKFRKLLNLTSQQGFRDKLTRSKYLQII